MDRRRWPEGCDRDGGGELIAQPEPSSGPGDGTGRRFIFFGVSMKAFGFLLLLILLTGVAVIGSVVLSCNLATQLDALRARL